MDIKIKLPEILRKILNTELSLGNEIDMIKESSEEIRIIMNHSLNKRKIYGIYNRVVLDPVSGNKEFSYSSSSGNFTGLDGYATESYSLPDDESIKIEYTTKKTAREILSPNLLPVLEFELGINNKFDLACFNPWSNVPFGIYLKNPLDHFAIREKFDLTKIEYYSIPSRPHVGGETGYRCKETLHILACLAKN